jgi:1-acyl-sn-glycerol-3-phosphate acyltransferase
MTVLWATRGPQFRTAYPGVEVDVCGATIVFYSPFVRDVCMWSGGREVSGSALRIALKQKRSVLLVPGGQREMGHSFADPNCLTLVTRHRGFIRMAFEHGTPLVPVLSLGETMLLENVHAPRMQKWTLRRIGFGFPMWPYGRWYSPLPNPHPVVVVFGHPIEVPEVKNPTVEQVEEVHKRYYGELQNMFHQHKHMIPGMENAKLVFTEE